MMAGRYSYHLGSRHGLMICAACGKPIEYEQYRVKEKADAYVTWHRSCTASDPHWMKLDAEAHDRDVQHKAFVQACIDFRTKWGVHDLDEYIDDATDDREVAK